MNSSISAGRGRLAISVVDRQGRPIDKYELLGMLGAEDPKNPPPETASSRIKVSVNSVDGRYATDVDPGALKIAVLAQGYRMTIDTATIHVGKITEMSFRLDSANTLHGTVLDRLTGKPISGASVAGPAFGLEAKSDSRGHFDVELPDGRISITVSAFGYRPLTFGGIRGDRSRDEVVKVELEPLMDAGAYDEFVGIGCRIEARQFGRSPFVAEVYAGTPASDVLKAGDDIVEVDGNGVENAYVENVIEMMLGDLDTTVSVTVRRGAARLNFNIRRTRISLQEIPSGSDSGDINNTIH